MFLLTIYWVGRIIQPLRNNNNTGTRGQPNRLLVPQLESLIEGAFMKRDMELIRLILLKIEEEYRSTAI